MERATANLETTAQRIRATFSAEDAAREKALRMGREVIRHSANSIRAIHRGEFDSARESLAAARQLVDEAKAAVADHLQMKHAGFIHDAQKEYAEGSITLALVLGQPLPTPEDLGVAYPADLHGLAESVGEMRRHLLDSLRKNDISGCEDLLSYMDDIYGILVTMDFPDALTFGLRRATDVLRGILEKTRGDLTLAMRQRDLTEKLDRLST